MKKLHGQSVLEYVLLVGIITVVLFAMMQAIKRGTQSLVRTAADQLSVQRESDQFFVSNNGYQGPEALRGYLESSNMATFSDSERQVVERLGVTNYIKASREEALTNSLTNMGFTEEDQ